MAGTNERMAPDGTRAESDTSLHARIVRGDERAFGELARRHAGRLRMIALRFCGDAAEADDVVQDTFLTVWRRASSWQPDGPPFGAWLTRITINLAIDRHRRHRLRRFFGLEAATEVADAQPTAEQETGARAALAAVTRDIGALPARQRAVILLAADGERSNADIAFAMGLSVGAVEQLLVRARRTLRLRLAEREGLQE
jgi:RNA polymerase sigma-70 factor (ECF subfamily)